MRVGPKNEPGFFCRRRCWTVSLLAGGLLGIMLCGEALGCEVHTVELYVADNEVDAQDTFSTSISICDCAYWVRVRWRANESGRGGDPYDGPFDVEVYEGTTKIDYSYNVPDVDPGWQQEVYEINSPPSALEVGTHTIKAKARRKESGGWKWSSNQCTVTVYGSCAQEGRWYAKADKWVSDVIGISCTIKTRYGKLCCEGFSDEGTFSAAACGIPDVNGKWAEAGYDRRRFNGSTTIKNHRYVWVEGSGSWCKFDDVNAPGEGTTYSYKCELDKSTGEWTFYFDGTPWISHTDSYWKHPGDAVAYQGEICHIENDMPGTSGNRCNFTSCEYKKDGGGYQSAGLTVAHVNSDDPNEWGAEYVDPNSFNIWDKNPL